MKISKRLLSVLLALILTVSVMLPASVSTASAATNTVTAYTSGSFVRAGSYYFSTVYLAAKNKYYLYRTNLNGTGSTCLAAGLSRNKVYTYRGIVYFEKYDRIYAYNSKTLKTSVFCKTKRPVSGICAQGLITGGYDESVLYLLSYQGKFKKIAGKNNSFLAANDNYVFYTKVVGKYKDDRYVYSETTQVMRYDLRSGATKTMGKFKAISSPYSGAYSVCYDQHVFRNTVVFTYGNAHGSAGVYYGSAFAMNADGTNIRKLRDDVGPWLTPGNNCIFIGDSNKVLGKITMYQISSAGKIKAYVKKTGYTYSTAGGYRLNQVSGSGSNCDLYVSTAGASGNGKLAIRAKKLVRTSDPSDAYGFCSVKGAVGNIALVTVDIYTYQGAIGWRARNLRTYVYLVNAKTCKLYRVA